MKLLDKEVEFADVVKLFILLISIEGVFHESLNGIIQVKLSIPTLGIIVFINTIVAFMLALAWIQRVQANAKVEIKIEADIIRQEIKDEVKKIMDKLSEEVFVIIKDKKNAA